MEDIEQLVNDFMAIREKRESLERDDTELKSIQERLKEKILGVCNDLGADSIKTKSGTVIKSLEEKYYTQDWANFHEWILEHKVPQFLEKRISQGNIREYLESNPEEGLPPGVNVFREYKVVIRKPNKS